MIGLTMDGKGLVAETLDIKKYYFVCYQDVFDHFEQKVLDTHPLKWQKNIEDECKKAQKYSESVKVISWQELSKEEYEQFKDHF